MRRPGASSPPRHVADGQVSCRRAWRHWSSSGATADALATALCVLGPEKGLALIESLPRVEAIVVGLDGKAAASKGLRSSLVVPSESGKKK